MEKEIVECIEQKGPLTGSDIKKVFSADSLTLWQTCKHSKKLIIKRVGRRYLRLDSRVNGFARLSPSILREFLTYSVIGLAVDPASISKKAREVSSHIEKVSKDKLDLAHSFVLNIQEQLGDKWRKEYQTCFVIAGDIVYKMAHDVPRPEQSTGRIVKGSDIDLVVVLEDRLPEEFVESLDDSIYQEKYRILTSPLFREEVDYVVKRRSRVREQVQFDTFKDMVACKILDEGILLHGSEAFFASIKALLHEHGVTEKLRDLKKRAEGFRKDAEEHLLYAGHDMAEDQSLYLFYTNQESEEFDFE
jgi:hypothetical protein